MKTNQKFILNLLTSLVNIKSVSGAEHEIMVYLEKKLTSWGVKTKRYRAGNKRFNLLARCGKGFPILCLNAHADTVPPFGNSVPCARVKNGALYGLGTCDTKASLAAMMTVVRSYVITKRKLNGTLDLLISIDEERKSREVYSVIKQGYTCDYAIVGEPTNLELVLSHMGQISLDIRAKGKSTHSSSPWKGRNAIDELTNIIGKVRCLVEDNKKISGIGKQSMNLGAIQGGDIPNRVPDSCRALIDIRILPGRATTDVLAKIAKVFKRNKNISYKVLKKIEPMQTDKNTSFVSLIKKQAGEVMGKRVTPKGARFWTEAADFRNELGAETVVYGPGEAKQAHSENEHIDLKQVFQAAEIYSATAHSLLSEALK